MGSRSLLVGPAGRKLPANYIPRVSLEGSCPSGIRGRREINVPNGSRVGKSVDLGGFPSQARIYNRFSLLSCDFLLLLLLKMIARCILGVNLGFF